MQPLSLYQFSTKCSIEPPALPMGGWSYPSFGKEQCGCECESESRCGCGCVCESGCECVCESESECECAELIWPLHKFLTLVENMIITNLKGHFN